MATFISPLKFRLTMKKRAGGENILPIPFIGSNLPMVSMLRNDSRN
jgi:hypothetical protein